MDYYAGSWQGVGAVLGTFIPSGLQHILAIRPQLIKLDISLVRSVDVDIARQALISGMAGFGRRMGALLVAEGVERLDQQKALSSWGCDLMQGYLYARPVPIDELTEWLRQF